MIFIFSNGNVRFIFRNMRFAFNEMKFIKLKSFTFQQTKFRFNKICIQKHSAERNIRSISCKSSLQVFSRTFRTFFAHCRDGISGRSSLLPFTVLLVSGVMPIMRMRVRAWLHECRHPQVFCRNITMICAYLCIAETCSRTCY